MHRPLPLAVLPLVFALAAAGALAAPRDSGKPPVYKWTDEHGVVHYGDAVPPQYADQDKVLLNAQGVPVGSIAGRRTPEQLAEEAAQRSAEERAQFQAKQSRIRDQNLLATYLTVDEIEALRDRRADLIDGQARVTAAYLEQLRGRQRQLEQNAQKFRPYNATPNAGPLPERLAEDLVRTTLDIVTQEHNLQQKRDELEHLRAQFASDIARFKELKRQDGDYGRAPLPKR